MKFLPTRRSALANSFLYISFLGKKMGTWHFVQLDTKKTLLDSCLSFQTFVVVRKNRAEKTAPNQNKWLLTGGKISFVSFRDFLVARISHFASKCCITGDQSHFVLKFCHMLSLYALQISSGKIYYSFSEKPDKLFGNDRRKNFLHLRQNDWNNWKVVRICVFIVQKF